MGATTSGLEKPAGARLPNRQAFVESENAAASREKKKKLSKLATLRKKLIRPRRHGRNYDHAKAIRELTSSWSLRELNALVDEYESLLALKELTVLADHARPSVNTFKRDLSDLYDYKYCTDVDLIYQGVCFPVHRAIVSARCPYFKTLLAKYSGCGTQVPVKIRTPGVDVNMFSALLRYLYTGEFYYDDPHGKNSLDTLLRLGEEFGTLNHLETDMQSLLESGDFYDAILVFTADVDTPDPPHTEQTGDTCTGVRTELPCHKAVLAARSPFFRNLLLRRVRSGEEATDRALQTPSRIVLDESVIPKQYARVLLNCIYLDVVDMSCVVRNSCSTCSLSEVQAMVSGRTHVTLVEQAMDIYQIGQFLDFPVLSQGCEDVIVESITVDNLVSVLNWSSEPHGSQYVHRQALRYLREEFAQIAHSTVLYELSKDYLVDVLKSDFTQASELEILSAALKWGEHHLIKRMEEREPNLITHTAHSVKKGIKKRDLNDIELRDILSEVLPYVRVDHVIPLGCFALNNAIKRGLISYPPSHMILDEYGRDRSSAWVRGRRDGMFVRPRLFMPYYDEVKNLLDDQLSQVTETDLVRLRAFHMSSVPDTLYMLGERTSEPRLEPPLSSCTVDIIAGHIPVPHPDMIDHMRRRECHLRHTKPVLHASSLCCADRGAIYHQVQLQVVREAGLPDSTVEVLQTVQNYTEHDPVDLYHYTPRRSPSAPGPLSTQSYYSPEKDSSLSSDSVLSEIMPDIAMASSSSLKKNGVKAAEMDTADRHATVVCKDSPDVTLQKHDVAVYNSLESRWKKRYPSASPDVAIETVQDDFKSSKTSNSSPDVTLDSSVNCPESQNDFPWKSSRKFAVTGHTPDVSACHAGGDNCDSSVVSDLSSPDVAANSSRHSNNHSDTSSNCSPILSGPDLTQRTTLMLDLTQGASGCTMPPSPLASVEAELHSASNVSCDNGRRKQLSPDVAMGASVLTLGDSLHANETAQRNRRKAVTTIKPDVAPLPSQTHEKLSEAEVVSAAMSVSPDVANHSASVRGKRSSSRLVAPSAEEEDSDSLDGTLYL